MSTPPRLHKSLKGQRGKWLGLACSDFLPHQPTSSFMGAYLVVHNWNKLGILLVYPTEDHWWCSAYTYLRDCQSVLFYHVISLIHTEWHNALFTKFSRVGGINICPRLGELSLDLENRLLLKFRIAMDSLLEEDHVLCYISQDPWSQCLVILWNKIWFHWLIQMFTGIFSMWARPSQLLAIFMYWK